MDEMYRMVESIPPKLQLLLVLGQRFKGSGIFKG